ncbi:MAG: cytidylate kinase-like family protein [Chloroflexota bacterium]
MALISVSREEGSWGGDVARGLATRLGYRLLDMKALIEESARFGGINPAAPELLERRPGLLERLDQDRRRYNVLLRAVVYDVALADNVVFLGRGTGMLLGDVSHALRLLVTCPVPLRIARIMERGAGGKPGPMTREQAEDIVRRSDRDRSAYVRYMFQKDWLDSTHHSLVASTASLEVPALLDLVEHMVRSGAYDQTAESRSTLGDLASKAKADAARLGGARR